MKQPDWGVIRKEYIKDENTSYRKLAKKHAVSLATLTERAIKEKWVELRKQNYDKTIAKTLEKISDEQSQRTRKFMDLTDEVMKKITEALSVCLPNDTQGLRQIVSSLKDLKDMQNIKSDADTREQDARIKNLEKQAEQGNSDTSVTVIFEGEAEDYTK